DGECAIISGYPKCLDEECKCKFLDENKANDTDNYKVNLRLWRGFYHDRFRDIVKDGLPHYIVGPNAGIAAYASWKPTVELIRNLNVPAIFSDYSEEAANLAARCLSTVTGHSLSLPIQLNPFRQPFMVEDAALCVPCFSNCFFFGIIAIDSKLSSLMRSTMKTNTLENHLITHYFRITQKPEPPALTEPPRFLATLTQAAVTE
ncbi:Zinc finger MYND domain-containing protein 15, partial [Nymphaea thermarum]